MKFPQEIVKNWEKLTYSFAQFEDNFEKYLDYCNTNATAIDCIYISDTDNPNSVVEKLGAALTQITSNCIEGNTTRVYLLDYTRH